MSSRATGRCGPIRQFEPRTPGRTDWRTGSSSDLPCTTWTAPAKSSGATCWGAFAFFTFLVHAQRIHELPEHLESRIVEPRLAWPPLAFLGRRPAPRFGHLALLQDAGILVLVRRLGRHARSLEHLLCRVDLRAGTHRERDGVGGAGIDLHWSPAGVEQEPGPERLVSQVRDDHTADGDA